ncbi:MAG: hypothetical protein DRP78_05050 [Candidatus Omnitrophota bacterium]|nr:MAG: hypothetical protein DRP78_05050 [Candidatus Omnitrophota bacterium]
MQVNLKDKSLLSGFSVFLSLTLIIGSIGIFQINSLTKIIRTISQRQLPMERLILEMKIRNAFYAMGVRNYVFWKISKYLQSASVAADIDMIEKSFLKLKYYLNKYSELADTQAQRKLIAMLRVSMQELNSMGRQLVESADMNEQDSDTINKLLINFENKFYQIEEILSGNLSRDNFKSIEEQLRLAQREKDISILILSVSLFLSTGLGIGISYMVYMSLRKERYKRAMLVYKMISVEEKERKNLSRQIHDQLSQDLSALKIYVDLISKDISDTDIKQKEKIKKSKEILVGLIDKGHNISELLRPPELDELGLVESIAALVSEHQQITGCNCNYYWSVSEINCSYECSLTFYRVVQEALTNSAKYSQAEHLNVNLSQKGKFVSLMISDDGIGFDYHKYCRKPLRRQEDKVKLGLRGIHERVNLLEGDFSIKTAPGKGTVIKVYLPETTILKS